MIFFLNYDSSAQFIKNFGTNDSTPNAGKERLIAIGLGGSYSAALYGLNELWYKNYPKSSFHFFNDNDEWMQIDKVGHALTAFHESRISIDLLRWAGWKEKNAILVGGLGGFIFQTPIEILDGFSEEWGASWGDVIANTTGSVLVISQELILGTLYVQQKMSFHPTHFSKLRPNTFGKSLNEKILKDYNGQTHWLSINLYPFFKQKSIPEWINFSVGYGAFDMLYGSPQDNQNNGYTAYRQWYFSPDIDLSKIKTNRKLIRVLFYTFNFVKIPMPTLEYSNKKRLKAHFLYF